MKYYPKYRIADLREFVKGCPGPSIVPALLEPNTFYCEELLRIKVLSRV